MDVENVRSVWERLPGVSPVADSGKVSPNSGAIKCGISTSSKQQSSDELIFTDGNPIISFQAMVRAVAHPTACGCRLNPLTKTCIGAAYRGPSQQKTGYHWKLKTNGFVMVYIYLHMFILVDCLSYVSSILSSSTWSFPKIGVPLVIIHFRLGFSMT